MIALQSQELFESLLVSPQLNKNNTGLAIVWFTAKWCGPCRRLGMEQVMAAGSATTKWYLCDVDDNTYTPGYCGVSSIPAFLAIRDGRPVGMKQISDTAAACAWVRGLGA
jgi:thioredoxin-like negative regulator of GroEL